MPRLAEQVRTTKGKTKTTAEDHRVHRRTMKTTKANTIQTSITRVNTEQRPVRRLITHAEISHGWPEQTLQ